MSYEVRGNLLYQWLEGEFRPVDDVQVAVADALDVLRAAWGPDAVSTEYQDSAGLVYRDLVAEDREGERTVARSPWRKVEQ